MKIVAILQNQWFNDPPRMKRILETTYKGDRTKFIRTFLFWSCLTGKRLEKAFGESRCEEIIWEEASPEIGDFASSKFTSDPKHVADVLMREKPDVILTFGKIAFSAVMKALEIVPNDFRSHRITCCHPAARHPSVLSDLANAAKELNEYLDCNPDCKTSGEATDQASLSLTEPTQTPNSSPNIDEAGGHKSKRLKTEGAAALPLTANYPNDLGEVLAQPDKSPDCIVDCKPGNGGWQVTLTLNPNSIEDYRRFLAVKKLPKYRVVGRTVSFPDEYRRLVYGDNHASFEREIYTPADFLFDYQRDISRLAIHKRKFATFVECGLGKSLIAMEFARHAAKQIRPDQCILIVSPLMVVQQTLDEAKKFYGLTLPIERVAAKNLKSFLTNGEAKIGITNYDGLDEDIPQGRLGGLVLDESSLLKSSYGAWGQQCLRLGKGLNWKLCLTGTPAPNDRIEFANHAVFMDAYPTVNSFLARFFVNRGETQNRWELKPHAIGPFYRALSHWSIFLSNPATYGWKDNTQVIPPIELHIDEVKMTDAQRELTQDVTGTLFGQNAGGIGSRSTLSQIAKGHYKGSEVGTLKPEFIAKLVASWPKESTLIWCRHNAEQEAMGKLFPDAANITGATPHWKREELINDFKAGRRKVMISKPKILGLGLNLQICTRMVFNGLNDSFEEFHQCVKRANRIGSTNPLNVHVPITSIERPMVETVLTKAKCIDADTLEQERIFKETAHEFLGL